MKRGDNQILRSVLLLILSSIAAFGTTLGVSRLFPSLGIKVYNPLSSLFPTPGGEATPSDTESPEEPTDPLLADAMRRDSLERADEALSPDSLEGGVGYQTDSLSPAGSVRAAEIPTGLTDYSGGAAIERLRSLLASAGEKPVNIAFLGDSFIEGDILVEPFRKALQAKYGGKGVGYVPLTSVTARFRQSIKHRFAGSWEDSNALKTPHGSRFLISGSYQRPTGSAEVTYENLSPVDRATLLYVAEDSLSITKVVNKGEQEVQKLPATGGALKGVTIGRGVSSLMMHFPASDHAPRLYGMLMDGDRGVRVDNMSLRGSSGLQLGGISTALSRGLHDLRPYQLIVLAYGLNVVSPKDVSNSYSYYYKGMDRVMQTLHEIYPEAIFLILSISDRGQLYDGKVYTIPGVPRMVEVQEKLARKYGALFFNTYGTIKSLGGIEAFVSKGWAAKDYTHMSAAGGRAISKELVQDLTETSLSELTQSRAASPIEESILPSAAQNKSAAPTDSLRPKKQQRPSELSHGDSTVVVADSTASAK